MFRMGIIEESLEDKGMLDVLKVHIRKSWYIHAFNDKTLLVVLWGRWFEIALERDES